MDKWYEMPGKTGTNVIYSRIRLVRNLKEYPFPGRLTKEQSVELSEKLLGGLTGIASMDRMQYRFTHLERMGDLEKTALLERRALNRSVMKKKDPTGMILSEDESTAILLNGDDHVRIQTLQTGLTLDRLYEKADRIDDYIGERFDYAFDEKYGYLTSYPTNTGTGLRACAILHLPTLSMGKKFSNMLAELSRFGVTIRGVYGEGSENYGALYEVANQKTLGQSEKEIVELVTKIARQLDTQERKVRRMALENHRLEREDEAYKSYGILKYARRLTKKDAMIFLSQLMAGMADRLIRTEEPCSVYRLMLGIQTANLQKLSSKPLNQEELDVARAAYLRRELPLLKEQTS